MSDNLQAKKIIDMQVEISKVICLESNQEELDKLYQQIQSLDDQLKYLLGSDRFEELETAVVKQLDLMGYCNEDESEIALNIEGDQMPDHSNCLRCANFIEAEYYQQLG